MAKLIIFFPLLVMLGCSGPCIKKSSLDYDYYVPSRYPLTPEYKNIHVVIDDKSLNQPEVKLEYEALKLGYSVKPNNAQILVFIHFQPSFLVQRDPITRKTVEYDEDNKGNIVYVMTNRGFIRTPYSLELVDTLNETLIFQTQGNGNYAIDAAPKPNKEETKQALLQVFHKNKQAARQALLDEIWKKLEGRYLQDIQVAFLNMKFLLVSEHESEPIFKQAFSLLKKNDKAAAKQALAIYNKAYKRYQASESDHDKAILGFINDGITAATQIVNDPNPQRYVQ